MEPSRRSARDNGLRCAGYASLGDFDPRVADSLLEELRTVGIAAYVTPTPATTGGYLETRHASPGLTDRLFVDSEKVERAKQIVEEEQAHPTPPSTGSASDRTDDIDIEAAWQQVLVSLQTPSAGGAPSWPASEDLPANTVHTFDSLPPLPDPVIEDDEHFVPPPPPPLPRLQRVTIVSLLAILAGILILVFNLEDGSLDWLAIIAILSGGAALVWNVKQAPPTDSGWDDGAVV